MLKDMARWMGYCMRKIKKKSESQYRMKRKYKRKEGKRYVYLNYN